MTSAVNRLHTVTIVRFGVSEPRKSIDMICYIVNAELLESSHEQNIIFVKNLELLARILLNHYHPFNKTLTGKQVDPKDASLLVLVTFKRITCYFNTST